MVRRGAEEELYPSAVVGQGIAASQAGVEVGNAVGATHRGVLVDLTAAVHVTAARQVPVRHGECRPREQRERERWREVERGRGGEREVNNRKEK